MTRATWRAKSRSDRTKGFLHEPLKGKRRDVGSARLGRLIESAVAMLGAKARAAGIHLVLARQQPSRKVITGNIQSNLLCRVALMLQSHIEFRMLLNVPGAERLTGSGDLLYKDFGDPIRLQAPYLPAAERAKWLTR